MSCNFTQLNVVPRAGLHGDLQCLALPASGSGTFPRASSSFGSLTLPVACHNPGNHTRGPHALTVVQRDAVWLQRAGRTTNRRVKYTAETHTCNPPTPLYHRLWQASHQLHGGQAQHSRATLTVLWRTSHSAWWSQEITSNSSNSRCQTQHVPHYVSPQLVSTLLLERAKQKLRQRRPSAEWPEQLQVWQRAREQKKPQVSLPGRRERKDRLALALPAPGKLPFCPGCQSSTQPRT